MKKINYLMVVNVLGLLTFLSLLSTGLIVHYILPPGSGSLDALGKGSGSISTYFGLTRHEWGEVHFAVSILFLVFLLIHIVLHWKWIVSVAWSPPAEPSIIWQRRVLTTLIVCFLIISLLFPWIGKKETYTRYELLQIRNLQQQGS